MPLPRATAEYGRPLAVKNLRVCYGQQVPEVRITRTKLIALESGDTPAILVADTTARTAPSSTCYDLSVTPQALAGSNVLILTLESTIAQSRAIFLQSVTLTVTPLAP